MYSCIVRHAVNLISIFNYLLSFLVCRSFIAFKNQRFHRVVSLITLIAFSGSQLFPSVAYAGKLYFQIDEEEGEALAHRYNVTPQNDLDDKKKVVKTTRLKIWEDQAEVYESLIKFNTFETNNAAEIPSIKPIFAKPGFCNTREVKLEHFGTHLQIIHNDVVKKQAIHFTVDHNGRIEVKELESPLQSVAITTFGDIFVKCMHKVIEPARKTENRSSIAERRKQFLSVPHSLPQYSAPGRDLKDPVTTHKSPAKAVGRLTETNTAFNKGKTELRERLIRDGTISKDKDEKEVSKPVTLIAKGLHLSGCNIYTNTPVQTHKKLELTVTQKSSNRSLLKGGTVIISGPGCLKNYATLEATHLSIKEGSSLENLDTAASILTEELVNHGLLHSKGGRVVTQKLRNERSGLLKFSGHPWFLTDERVDGEHTFVVGNPLKVGTIESDEALTYQLAALPDNVRISKDLKMRQKHQQIYEPGIIQLLHRIQADGRVDGKLKLYLPSFLLPDELDLTRIHHLHLRVASQMKVDKRLSAPWVTAEVGGDLSAGTSNDSLGQIFTTEGPLRLVAYNGNFQYAQLFGNDGTRIKGRKKVTFGAAVSAPSDPVRHLGYAYTLKAARAIPVELRNRECPAHLSAPWNGYANLNWDTPNLSSYWGVGTNHTNILVPNRSYVSSNQKLTVRAPEIDVSFGRIWSVEKATFEKADLILLNSMIAGGQSDLECTAREIRITRPDASQYVLPVRPHTVGKFISWEKEVKGRQRSWKSRLKGRNSHQTEKETVAVSIDQLYLRENCAGLQLNWHNWRALLQGQFPIYLPYAPSDGSHLDYLGDIHLNTPKLEVFGSAVCAGKRVFHNDIELKIHGNELASQGCHIKNMAIGPQMVFLTKILGGEGISIMDPHQKIQGIMNAPDIQQKGKTGFIEGHDAAPEIRPKQIGGNFIIPLVPSNYETLPFAGMLKQTSSGDLEPMLPMGPSLSVANEELLYLDVQPELPVRLLFRELPHDWLMQMALVTGNLNKIQLQGLSSSDLWRQIRQNSLNHRRTKGNVLHLTQPVPTALVAYKVDPSKKHATPQIIVSTAEANTVNGISGNNILEEFTESLSLKNAHLKAEDKTAEDGGKMIMDGGKHLTNDSSIVEGGDTWMIGDNIDMFSRVEREYTPQGYDDKIPQQAAGRGNKKNLNMFATGSIKTAYADLKGHEEVNIHADVAHFGAVVTEHEKNTSGKNYSSHSHTTKHNVTTIMAKKKNANIHTTTDQQYEATQVSAGSNIYGTSEGTIGIDSVHDTHDTSSEKHGKKRRETVQGSSIISRGAKFEAGHNVEYEATGDIKARIPTIKGEKVSLTSHEGTPYFLSDKSVERVSTQKSKKGKFWQSQKSDGSIDEHVLMPKIEANEVKVKGVQGAIVEIPQNISLDTLASKPGYEWIQELRKDPSTTWRSIHEEHNNWKHKKHGLTPGGAALISLAVGIATGGVGAKLALGISQAISATVGSVAVGNMAGVAASTAFTSLVSQGSVTLVNNKGHIGKTLKHLGKSEQVRALLTSMTAAALTYGICDQLGIAQAGDGITDGVFRTAVQTGVSAGIEVVTQHQDADKALLQGLRSAGASVMGASVANILGDALAAGDLDPFTHKVLHAIGGALQGVIISPKDASRAALAGATGAFVAEVVAESLPSSIDLQTRANIGILSAGATAFVTQQNVNIAGLTATVAAENNFKKHTQQGKQSQEDDGYDTDDEAETKWYGEKHKSLIDWGKEKTGITGESPLLEKQIEVYQAGPEAFAESRVRQTEHSKGTALSRLERDKVKWSAYQEFADDYIDPISNDRTLGAIASIPGVATEWTLRGLGVNKGTARAMHWLIDDALLVTGIAGLAKGVAVSGVRGVSNLTAKIGKNTSHIPSSFETFLASSHGGVFLKPTSNNINALDLAQSKNNVDLFLNNGRTGKQARLKELSNDLKIGSADRGWLQQELNSIERGKRTTLRVPLGKELAHKRGFEAAKGFDYSYSNLQDKSLHKLQHKYDGMGKKNKQTGQKAKREQNES